MAVKNVSTKKKSKKVWISIHAPEVFNKAFLGESYVYLKEDLIGKPLNLNLSTFVNDMKKQNINILFKVASIQEGKGVAEIMGLILNQSYIKRLVRRGKNKVEDSFLAKTSDNKTIRVKPIIITNSKTHQSVVSKLRLDARVHLKRIIKTMTPDSFVKELTDLRLQKEIKEKLQKIYPLRYFDVRYVSTEKDRVVVDELVEEAKSQEENLDDDLEGMDENDDEESTETTKSEDSEELNEDVEEVEEDSDDLDDSDDESAEEEESKPKKSKSKK